MKNFTFLSLLILSLTTTFAQEFQGKAYYISKTKMDPNFGKNIPPERKQRIMERIKSVWMFLEEMDVLILCRL